MKNEEFKICLVDDNDSFREGIKYFLKSNNSNWKINQEYNSGEAFYKGVMTKDIPDIILMDYKMPGVDGITITKEYLFQFPKVKVLAVTMYSENLFLDKLIMAGFKGCIQKRNVHDQIIPAISKIIKGGQFFDVDFKISKH